MLTPNIRMGEICDLSVTDCGMVASCMILETDDLEFVQNGAKKQQQKKPCL